MGIAGRRSGLQLASAAPVLWPFSAPDASAALSRIRRWLGLESAPDEQLFDSFFLGGFESSAHRQTRDQRQLDLIAATRHDQFVLEDYRMARRCGISSIRDALRWHLIEAEPGRYDWSSFLPMIRAARTAGVQVIWDLCHYGVPAWLDIWSDEFLERFAAFCAAAARIVAEEGDGRVPFYCAMNEINFWAWGGGDHGHMYPHSIGRGPELKRRLARAAIVAIDAVRAVEPRARFIQAEPLINVVTPPEASDDDKRGAEEHMAAQFEAFDMIAGRLYPELGGSEAHLDLIGLNFYPHNQFFRGGAMLPVGHWFYRPLQELLVDVHRRYPRHDLLLTETGAEGANGTGWLRYVGGEVRAALRLGVPVRGVCLYPIMDYPGWNDGRHCRCGLIHTEDDWRRRVIDWDLLEELDQERRLCSGSLARPGRRLGAEAAPNRLLLGAGTRP